VTNIAGESRDLSVACHKSILSRSDRAFPNDFFSIDLLGTVQFRRALWCQWFFGKSFGEEKREEI
jgi:hypothetical protein